MLHSDKSVLNLADVLTALSICAVNDEKVRAAYEKLVELKDCEAHSSCMIPDIDAGMFRKLGVNLTCEPEFSSKELYGG